VAQRLTRTASTDGHPLAVQGLRVVESHEQLASILASRLGKAHADLLAVPKVEGDGISWSTALRDEAVKASTLDADERAKLEQRSQRLLGEIRGLAQVLAGEGDVSLLVSQMLDRAVQTPPGDWLYGVGGKPVLVMWGHAGSPEAPPPPPPPPPPVQPAPAAAASPAPQPPAKPAEERPAIAANGGGAQRPVVQATARDRRWWPWLLLGLLAAALAAWIAWTLHRPAKDDGDIAMRIAQAEDGNRALEAQIAQRKGQQPQMQCVPDPPAPIASAPEPIASAAPPEPAASLPEPPPSVASAPAPDPYDALKKRVEASGKDCTQLQAMLGKEPLLKGRDARALALKKQVVDTLSQNCGEKLIKEAKNLCPGERPKELAPELVIAFDASGSMGFSLLATEQEIQQAPALEQMQNLARLLTGRNPGNSAMEHLTREPRRITAAKQATVSVAEKVPSDANVGLVLIEQCPQARPVGFFPPGRHGELVSQLKAIEPVGGTPLADGVAKAGQMLDGVKRESVMLVVSDGVESCGQNPCAVAAALARAKPHLKINVVDITGTGAGNCLAQATGGKVFAARNADEVISMMKQAAADAMGPASCKKQ